MKFRSSSPRNVVVVAEDRNVKHGKGSWNDNLQDKTHSTTQSGETTISLPATADGLESSLPVDTCLYCSLVEFSETSFDDNSVITLIVLPANFSSCEESIEATLNDLSAEEERHRSGFDERIVVGPLIETHDLCFDDSCSSLTSLGSVLSEQEVTPDEIQEGEQGSWQQWDEADEESRLLQEAAIPTELRCPSPSQSLESVNDSYFTEGFVNVGQLLGAY